MAGVCAESATVAATNVAATMSVAFMAGIIILPP
jgi:hypothetical protein